MSRTLGTFVAKRVWDIIGTVAVQTEIAIIGVGQTPYSSWNSLQSANEMVLDAVELALADASMGLGEIDAAVTSCIDLWDGRTASNFYLTEVVGAVMKPETRVAGDGSFAVLHAALTLLSGAYRRVLVVSSCRGSEADHETISNWVFDPIYQQPLGLDYLSAAALQANYYMDQFGLSANSCGQVVVKNRRNGALNPRAMLRRPVSLEEVVHSEVRSYPIRAMDVAPTGDGACALVMARAEVVDEAVHRPVWIQGMASALGAHYLGDRVLSEDVALRMAATRAYRMAGVRDPLDEIGVVELSEYYSYQELMWSESLGLCPPGKGADLLLSGETEIQGKIPVNPSGGLLSGCPYVVAGMARVAECALQLRGEAGGCQVPHVSRALAHGTSGPCGQAHCVIILGNR